MSYEGNIKEKIKTNNELPEKLNLSILKYFWQASPLSGGGDKAIPKFLRSIKVLKNFSDNELRILSHYLHLRYFSSKEVIFEQDENGVGFYFIYSGQVEILAKNYKIDNHDELIEVTEEESGEKNLPLIHITTLERRDHFGEIALLQDNSLRTATAIAKESCCLIGLFKPDMNELINNHPVIAAKLLQSISIILADRLSSVAREMKVLKYKLFKEGYDFKGKYQK